MKLSIAVPSYAALCWDVLCYVVECCLVTGCAVQHRAVLCCIVQVLLDTLQLSSVIKKTPVVVGNCTGFAVNRVFFPYTMAACLLMDCGVNPFQVCNSNIVVMSSS